MHSVKILLTIAENNENAIGNAENFLEDYYGIAYDWYAIGGRWERLLNRNAELLSTCLDKVKEYLVNIPEQKEYFYKQILENKKKNEYGSAYYARRYADTVYGRFTFDTGVYNIKTNEAEIIPKDINKYWAVVCDLHN